jgi:hypothetical protein
VTPAATEMAFYVHGEKMDGDAFIAAANARAASNADGDAPEHRFAAAAWHPYTVADGRITVATGDKPLRKFEARFVMAMPEFVKVMGNLVTNTGGA